MFLLRSFRFALCALALTAVAYAQTVSFSQDKYPVGINPRSVTIGDVHPDGVDDIVTGNHDGRTISVLVNDANGSGVFQPAVDSTTFTISPDQVIAADFNGDGLVDIALVSKQDANLSIMYGKAGGGFTTPIGVNWGGGVPTSIAVDDFNGDFKPDIAVTVDAVNTGVPAGVHLLINSGTTNPNGDSVFNTPQVLITGGAGTRFWNVVSGDVNGDSKRDLAFLTCCSSNANLPNIVEEMINNGDGTFTPRPIDQGTAVGLYLADLDVNGRDDIIEPYGPAGCNGCSNTAKGVTWIFNETNGTFTKSGAVFTGTQVFTGAVTAAKFSQTPAIGRDFALTATGSVNGSSGPDEVLVFTNTGTRSFNPPQAISLGTGVGVNDIRHLKITGAPKGPEDMVVTLGNANEAVVLRNNTPAGSICAAPLSAGVRVCSPGNGGTVGSPVQISAAANGGGKPITAMKAYIDGVQVAASSSGSLSASVAAASGSHRLNVNAWNTAGTVFTFAGTFTVSGNPPPPPPGGCSAPTTSPAINICQPLANQTVSSPVSILAKARWDGKTISHMRVYVDNVARCDGNSSSITCQVALPAGTHSITVNTWNTTGAVITQHESFIVH